MWKNMLWTARSFVRRYTTASTVDSSEMRHFKQFTEEWWNEQGHLRALHALNKLRIPLIRDGIISILQKEVNNSTPLKEISVLDVGCGGGILTEPLARIGSNVTGLDPNCDLIEKAKVRAKDKNLNVDYICSSIEDYACDNQEKHDAVVASEILEHVTQKKEFLNACIQCLKPGGSIFITTINKTPISNVLGIILAENVLNLLPKGTHQHDKFIKPHNLEKILEDLNCKTILVQGMFYNFVRNEWIWCSNDSVNYALHAVKLNN